MTEQTGAGQGVFDQFSRIYCINLKASSQRREYIKEEFARVGINVFEFVEAFDKDSEEVSRLYHSDFVKKYPPCFRCGKDSCDCANKSLFRPQIGNWLSHIKVWKNISKLPGGLALVCEDDVKFQENVHHAMQVVARSAQITRALGSDAPVLVRFGWALCAEHTSGNEPVLTQDIRVSNPCYAMNAPMARFTLDSLQEIATTSDVYLHRQIGPTVHHFTIMPPAAYELSWSTGGFVSEIRPKERRLEYLKSRLEKLDPESPDYQDSLASYKQELQRLQQYERFNESPKLDYEDEYNLI